MSCCCGCDDWKSRAEKAESDRDHWWRKWNGCLDRDHWKSRAEKAENDRNSLRARAESAEARAEKAEEERETWEENHQILAEHHQRAVTRAEKAEQRVCQLNDDRDNWKVLAMEADDRAAARLEELTAMRERAEKAEDLAEDRGHHFVSTERQLDECQARAEKAATELTKWARGQYCDCDEMRHSAEEAEARAEKAEARAEKAVAAHAEADDDRNRQVGTAHTAIARAEKAEAELAKWEDGEYCACLDSDDLSQRAEKAEKRAEEWKREYLAVRSRLDRVRAVAEGSEDE